MRAIKIGHKGFIIVLEAIAAVAVLLGLLVGVAAWRLSQGPMDVGFAKDYVQEALRDSETGSYVTLDNLTLHWPDFTGPLLLHVSRGGLFNGQGQQSLSVEEMDIALSRSRLLLGQIAPVSLIFNQPQLRVIRGQDGRFGIGLQTRNFYGPPSPDQINRQGAVIDAILAAFQRRDEEGVPGPLARLRRLEINQAQIVVEDQVLGTSWVLPNANFELARTRAALMGHLFFMLSQGKAGDESEVEAQFSIARDTGRLMVDADVKRFPLSFLTEKMPALSDIRSAGAYFDTHIRLATDREMKIESGEITLASGGGELLIPSYSAQKPLVYKDLNIAAQLTEEGILSFEKADIKLGDALHVHASGALQRAENGFLGPVEVRLDPVAHSAIEPVWPDTLKHDASYEWIVQKLSGGDLKDLKAKFELHLAPGLAGAGAPVSITGLEADFSFDNMTADYKHPLMPVTAASGKGRFYLDQEKLDVEMTQGKIGGIAVKNAVLEFVNIIKPGAGKADLSIDLQGPLPEVLKYVSSEPIDVHTAFDPARVRGDVAAKVNLAFPTHKNVKKEEVIVNVKGTMDNIAIPDVVRTLSLSGGPLQIEVNKGLFTLAGQAMIDNRPATLRYEEFLSAKDKPFESKINVSLNADPALREKFGVDLSDFLEGQAGLQIEYTDLPQGRAQAQIKADLTQARLFVNPIGFEKPQGVAGQAALTAVLQDGGLRRIENLTASAPEFNLSDAKLVFDPANTLQSGTIGRFSAGKSQGRVDFTIKNGVQDINVAASSLDIQGALRGGDKQEGIQTQKAEPARHLNIKTDRLIAAEKDSVGNAVILADLDTQGRFNRLEITGQAGRGPMEIRFSPDASGRLIFRAQAADAGATLRAFNIYDNIRGGTLVIDGESAEGAGDRNITGVGQITDFKVVEAPTLARMLSALSLPGLMSLLNNEGLAFSKMESRFEWIYRRQGSFLALKDGRTSGNSVGLTFDATFDLQKDTMDVSGTIVPLSEVNKIISSIPLVGDILTGGTGSLIAATYTIKGPTEKPDVFVNPLSVLTPGLLRRILFEN